MVVETDDVHYPISQGARVSEIVAHEEGRAYNSLAYANSARVNTNNTGRDDDDDSNNH